MVALMEMCPYGRTADEEATYTQSPICYRPIIHSVLIKTLSMLHAHIFEGLFFKAIDLAWTHVIVMCILGQFFSLVDLLQNRHENVIFCDVRS